MIYTISFFIIYYFLKIVFRGEARGLHNYPRKGPFIAAFNHNSYMDILAISLAINFRVHGLGKRELFEMPFLGWWLRKMNVHPIVRDAGDEKGFRHLLDLLKSGARLFISPEGTRKWKDGKPPRARTGFVRLAQLVKCPIVPVAISNTREILAPNSYKIRFKKIVVRVGKPIYLPPVEVTLENKQILQEQANRVMNEVYKLVISPRKKK